MNLFAIRLGPHALERRLAALMNHVRDIGNLAADDAAECRSDAAEKPHRLDAVADHDPAWSQPLQPHAIDLVARQAGQLAINRHDAPRIHCGYSST